MEIKELEEKYTIHIEKKDEMYLYYNYFGRLLDRAKSLSEIDKKMKKYYEGMDNKR